MDKKKWQITSTLVWLITIILLFVVIIIDRSAKLDKILIIIFYGGYLVVPIVMTILQLYYYQKLNINDKSIYSIVPFISKIILVSFGLISFVFSLNSQGKKVILITIAIIIFYNILSIYLTLKRKFNFKHYQLLLIISLLSVVIFLVIGFIVSWKYSIRW